MFTKRIKNKSLLIGVAFANALYLFWRIFFTMPTKDGILSFIFGLLLLLAEISGIFELFVTIDGINNRFIPKLPEIDKEQFPEVDIFIATYNEDIELVRKTILGCKNMKYHKNTHIFLCDDGKRSEFQKMSKELGIRYLSRETNRGAKAGNLNNALKNSNSPLIVTFDADMIPMENFLLETIPYFLENVENASENINNIGFIQTPQSFYNVDLFQKNFFSHNRIPNEQDYFYKNVQTTRNHTNSVIYGGSNTVISRKALNSIGGFFENSITEDFATGILIQSKGYKCYAINKVLASGLSPKDIESLLNQRERWARGCIQTLKVINIFKLKEFTLKQKISYLSSITYWYSCLKRFLYILSPIAITVFGINVINCKLIEVLIIFLPMHLLTSFTLKYFSDNVRNSRWTSIYETITFPSLLKAVLLETIGNSKKNFLVTDKSKNEKFCPKYNLKKARIFYFYILLSAIGLFNVIFYLNNVQIVEYATVIFWLILNILYLFMAIMFILGVENYEIQEKYKAKVDFEIKQRDICKKYKTIEIFEEGIYFHNLNRAEINISEDLEVNFQIKNNIISMKGQCILVKPSANPLYILKFKEITTENRDLWNVFLHNRIPTLPVNLENSKNIFSDLSLNIKKRLTKNL